LRSTETVHAAVQRPGWRASGRSTTAADATAKDSTSQLRPEERHQREDKARSHGERIDQRRRGGARPTSLSADCRALRVALEQ